MVKGKILYQVPLSRYTSLHVGGIADIMMYPANLTELQQVINVCRTENVPYFILGRGSNLVIRDGGIRGIVIKLSRSFKKIKIVKEFGNHVGLLVEAGVSLSRLLTYSVSRGLSGMEFTSGIPGSLGGALAMNAGAFGGETWSHVVSVETIDRDGNVHKRDADEYQVGYRSVSGPADEWFTAAIFQFEQGDGSAASEAIKKLLARRAETQPMGAASCGSVFTNPDNDHAARLIESCGLKGYRIGGAVVSEKHANFIINDNNASTDDIESLIKYVQNTVLNQQGVELQTEVRIVGAVA